MDWEKIKKLNVRIEVPTKVKKLLFLILGSVFVYWFNSDIIDYMPLGLYRVFKFIMPVLNALPAIIIFIIDKRKIKDLFQTGILKQTMLGLFVGAILLSAIMVMNGGLDITNETAMFIRHDWYKVYISVYYLIMVGYMEEFTYRVMVQEYLIDILGKFKILAPLISSALFSVAHLYVAGNLLLIIAFIWGLIWGYLKYFCKDFTFYAAALSHGVYDYGLMILPFIMRLFI